MIIVAGKLYVDAPVREGYLAGCRAVIEQARATPGCLDFTLSADPLEAERINVYERWESEEALSGFRGDGPPPSQEAVLRDVQVEEFRL